MIQLDQESSSTMQDTFMFWIPEVGNITLHLFESGFVQKRDTPKIQWYIISSLSLWDSSILMGIFHFQIYPSGFQAPLETRPSQVSAHTV